MANTTTSAFMKPSPSYGDYGLDFSFGGGTKDYASTPVGDNYVTKTPNMYESQISGLQKENADLSSKLDSNSFFNNKDKMAGFAGLGSVLLQAVALPDQLKMARTQRRALEQNMAVARQEQDRRNKNISSFNNVRSSQPTSAFAQKDK